MFLYLYINLSIDTAPVIESVNPQGEVVEEDIGVGANNDHYYVVKGTIILLLELELAVVMIGYPPS